MTPKNPQIIAAHLLYLTFSPSIKIPIIVTNIGLDRAIAVTVASSKNFKAVKIEKSANMPTKPLIKCSFNFFV